MKKVIIIFFIILFSPAVKSQDLGTWVLSDTLFMQNRVWGMNKLQCIDSLNCISVIPYGKWNGYIIRRTTDGGNTWSNVYADTTFQMEELFVHKKIWDFQYLNKNLCIAVGDSGLILRSTDNGETWQDYSHRKDSLMMFKHIGMYDENEGYLLGGRIDSFLQGGKPRFWRTSDGGKNWKEYPYPKYPFPYAIRQQMINRDLIIGQYIVEEKKENDTIRTEYLAFILNDWTEYDSVVKPASCYYKYFLDRYNGWVAGNKFTYDSLGRKKYTQLIYHTSDGGLTWEKQREKYYNNFRINAISFYDKNFGMCGVDDNTVLITYDGGKHWYESKTYVPDGGGWWDIDIVVTPSRNVAYVSTNIPSYIYKWTRTPTDVKENDNAGNFSISPNPATDYIDIQIPEGTGTDRTLKDAVRVYDVLGVCVLEHTYTPPDPLSRGGEIRLDVSGLAAGVYFVRVGGRVLKFVKL